MTKVSHVLYCLCFFPSAACLGSTGHFCTFTCFPASRSLFVPGGQNTDVSGISWLLSAHFSLTNLKLNPAEDKITGLTRRAVLSTPQLELLVSNCNSEAKNSDKSSPALQSPHTVRPRLRLYCASLLSQNSHGVADEVSREHITTTPGS